MIIKRLRFKNLNSLAGEWEIDFTAPEYTSEGIFLITGQTGVGKTTILDAICLALYGQTPRLKKINKSENEIIRRQTSECFAEIHFETPAGSYRCHWSQRRAHSKADGNLQDPKHEISDASTGIPIATSISATPLAVSEICGLKFDQFTRSIMLAQGDFAKFLDASASDRSDILENITGSKIYSEISKDVHLRKVREDAKLKEIIDQMSGIQLLTPEQVEDLNSAFALSKSQVVSKKKELETLQTALHWTQSIDKEKTIIQQTSAKATAHAELTDQAKPEKLALKKAQNAREVQPHFRDWERSDLEQKKLNQSLLESNQLNAQQTALYQQQLEAAEAAKTAYQQQRQISNELEPKLREASKLSARVEEATIAANTQRDAYKNLQKQAKARTSTIAKTAEQLAKITSQQQTSQQYLEQHPAHNTLISELSGMRQLGEAWKASLKQLDKTKTSNKSTENSIALLTKQLSDNRESLAKEQAQLKQTEQAIIDNGTSLTKALAGKTKPQLESALSDLRAKRILDLEHLEQFRESLSKDQPCPVCGSLEHPYSEQTPPSQNETKLAIQALEKQLVNIAKLENSTTTLTLDKEKQLSLVNQRDSKISLLKEQLTEKQTLLESERIESQSIQAQIQTQHQQLTEKITPFTKTQLTLDSLDPIFQELSQQAATWKNHFDASSQFNENKATLTTTLTAENKALSELQSRMQEIAVGGKESVAKLATLTEALKQLIGDSSIEALKADDKAKLKHAEQSAENQNKLREQHKAKLDAIQTQQTETTKRLDQLKNLIEEQHQQFTSALKANAFTSQEEFISARLESTQLTLLEQKISNLQLREQQLQTTLTDAKKRLEKESAKQLTEKSGQEITEQIKLTSSDLDTISNKFGALQQQLTDHQNAQKNLDSKIQARTAQETECLRWSRLHGLIGASDGKKFRNFAQGLTFEIMVRHANDQLAKMTDRYQLIRDLEQPLDLSVIDSYQAGEIRSTKNLSGGESFIISLALALGLSKMASKNVQVDSLFLDEGFGTLDEEALETAIDTLASMNQEGKIIGIISHIPALKDRITSQIRLERSTHGSAIIRGAGVRKITD